MTADHGGSAPESAPDAVPDTARQPGWFARIPLWLRVAIPAVLALVVGAIAVAAFSGAFAGGAPSDPEAAAEAQCRAAATERLESRGHTDIEIARSLAVTTQADGAYRVEGTVTFDEDGTTSHTDLRCIVRVADGTATVVSVRFRG